jgi:hypothetical protein
LARSRDDPIWTRKSHAEEPTDRRALAALAAEERDEALRDRTRAALDEAGSTYTEVLLDEIVADLRGIARDADAVKARFLAAGRKLLALQKRLDEGGYKALLRSGLVAIDESTASMMRQVALAVDQGRVPEEALPRTLRPAYIAARLKPDVARQLIEDGTLRPEVSSRRLEQAAAELDDPASTGWLTGPDASPASPVPARLTARRRRELMMQLARYEARAQELRRLLGLPERIADQSTTG